MDIATGRATRARAKKLLQCPSRELVFAALKARATPNSVQSRQQITVLRKLFAEDWLKILLFYARGLQKFLHPHSLFAVWAHDFDSVNGPWPPGCISTVD